MSLVLELIRHNNVNKFDVVNIGGSLLLYILQDYNHHNQIKQVLLLLCFHLGKTEIVYKKDLHMHSTMDNCVHGLSNANLLIFDRDNK